MYSQPSLDTLCHTQRDPTTQATVAGTRRVWLQRNEGAKVGQPEAPAAVHPTPTAKRADTDSSLVQGAGPAEQLRDAAHNQVRQRPARAALYLAFCAAAVMGFAAWFVSEPHMIANGLAPKCANPKSGAARAIAGARKARRAWHIQELRGTRAWLGHGRMRQRPGISFLAIFNWT